MSKTCARLAGLAGCLLLVSCGSRVQLRPDHGDKTQAWQQRQAVHPQPPAKTADGLDSEEAAIIHGRYRGQLSGTNAPAPTDEPRVLILDEGSRNGKRR